MGRIDSTYHKNLLTKGTKFDIDLGTWAHPLKVGRYKVSLIPSDFKENSKENVIPVDDILTFYGYAEYTDEFKEKFSCTFSLKWDILRNSCSFYQKDNFAYGTALRCSGHNHFLKKQDVVDFFFKNANTCVFENA